jgi:uncharacterized protein RhaS with RHS repeats
MGARYFDPDVGRFITPDPIGAAGGLNIYQYCNNDPVNYKDPLGLAKIHSVLFSLDEYIILGAQVGVGVVWDDNGEWGLIGCSGGGIGTKVGVGKLLFRDKDIPDFFNINETDIESLNGWSSEASFSYVLATITFDPKKSSHLTSYGIDLELGQSYSFIYTKVINMSKHTRCVMITIKNTIDLGLQWFQNPSLFDSYFNPWLRRH